MENEIRERLQSIEFTLKHLLALNLYRNGVNQETIGKHLSMAKASVNNLLKGVKKSNDHEKE